MFLKIKRSRSVVTGIRGSEKAEYHCSPVKKALKARKATEEFVDAPFPLHSVEVPVVGRRWTRRKDIEKEEEKRARGKNREGERG